MIQEQPFSFHQPKAAIQRTLEASFDDESDTVDYFENDQRVFRMMPCSTNETSGLVSVFFKLCRDGNCHEYKKTASEFVHVLQSYSKGIQRISDRCDKNPGSYCDECFPYAHRYNPNNSFTCNGASQTCESFSTFGSESLRCGEDGKLKYLVPWGDEDDEDTWSLYGYYESTEGGASPEEEEDNMLYCATDFGTLYCSKTRMHKHCSGWCEMVANGAIWIGDSPDDPQARLPTGPPTYGMQFCMPMHSEPEPMDSQPTPLPTVRPVLESRIPLSAGVEEGSQNRRLLVIILFLAISGLVFSLGFIWRKRLSTSRYSQLAKYDEESMNNNNPAVQEFDYRSIELSDLSLRDHNNGTMS